jgi:hypothetical protein
LLGTIIVYHDTCTMYKMRRVTGLFLEGGSVDTLNLSKWNNGLSSTNKRA